MLNLSSHTLFLEKDGHGYVYNWNTKKLLVTNLSVISILKLCNGKRTLDEVIRFFAMSIQRDVYKVVQELIAVDILIDGSVFARTSKYEEITSFFLSLTHQCNLNCHFCLKHNLTKYKELEHKEWVKIINIISEFNDKNKTIYLTGGEPLMMAQFEKIYTYIYQKICKLSYIQMEHCLPNVYFNCLKNVHLKQFYSALMEVIKKFMINKEELREVLTK